MAIKRSKCGRWIRIMKLEDQNTKRITIGGDRNKGFYISYSGNEEAVSDAMTEVLEAFNSYRKKL